MFEHCSMNGFQTFSRVEMSSLVRSPYSRGTTTAAAATRMRTVRRPCSSDNFRGVRIGNGSSCINLWRLLRSVPRGATCWLCTGAVRTCAVPWILCYTRVSYGRGMPCLLCGYCHGNAIFFLYDRLCRSTLAQSCPWVGLTRGLGWVGNGSEIFVFSGLGWVIGLKWLIFEKWKSCMLHKVSIFTRASIV